MPTCCSRSNVASSLRSSAAQTRAPVPARRRDRRPSAGRVPAAAVPAPAPLLPLSTGVTPRLCTDPASLEVQAAGAPCHRGNPAAATHQISQNIRTKLR